MEDIGKNLPHQGEELGARNNESKPHNRVAELYIRMAETNPSFKIVKNEGRGYVIGGVDSWPPRRKQ